MPNRVHIADPTNDTAVSVSSNGELHTAPLHHNQSIHYKLDTINTAYTFADIQTGKEMHLENILIYANKGVGTNDATVTIYTSLEADSLVVKDVIMEFEIPKYGTRDLIGLNLKLGGGVYLNAKTDDNDIFLTMMGYYSDESSD